MSARRPRGTRPVTAVAQLPGLHPAQQRQDRATGADPRVTFCEGTETPFGRELIIDETAGQLPRLIGSARESTALALALSLSPTFRAMFFRTARP